MEYEEVIDDLRKKYLGKEMTLLEMDNLFEYELHTTCSLFEDVETALEQQSWAYICGYDDNNGEYGIIVGFAIVESVKNLEDLKRHGKEFYIRIKINEISVL